MGRILLIISFFLSSSVVFSQGSNCSEVEPFCAGGNVLVFPNTNRDLPGSLPTAESGIDYSCVTSGGPSDGTNWLYPVWYYLRIDSDGDLVFTISQSVNADGTGGALDVDFVAWGPFSTSNVDCSVDLTNSNKVDCSYLDSTTEIMTITGAQEGEIYIVMISNYSEMAGFITVQQTNTGGGSSGSTDCSIVNTDNYCEDEVVDLDATTKDAVSYEWFQDTVPLAETGPILTNVVAPSATYTANAIDNLGSIITPYEFNINFEAIPIAFSADDMLQCDDDTDGLFDFDLRLQTDQILGSQDSSMFRVTYHLTQAEANSGDNALSSPYQNTLNPQPIYARIENNNLSDCEDTTLFNIEVFDTPSASIVPPQLICDDDNDGFWSFDFTSLDATVLGMQSDTDYTITYHNSLPNAEANAGAITSPYTNATAYQQEEIFVRIENNSNTECFETTSFMFDVFDTPTATQIPPYSLCDNDDDGDDTNGFVIFDLNSIADQVLGAQDLNQFIVSYHLNQTDAGNGDNDLLFNYINETANTQQIIARVENVDNTNCYETALIDLEVYQLPIINLIVELFQCDDDSDGFVNFSLTEAEELISTNYLNETFTYYTTLTDAKNDIGAITDPTVYTNIDSSAAPDILFVRTENTDGCYKTSQLNLLVSTTNVEQTFQLPYNVCDNIDIDGDDSNGIATFDFSEAQADIEGLFPPGQPVTITYYETIENALAEINAISDISNHRNDASPHGQNIYVRVDNDLDNSCLGLGHHITLQVDALPVFTISNESLVCVNVNGTGQVEFPPLNTELSDLDYSFVWSLNGDLLPLETASTLLPTVGGTYSVLVTNTLTGCSDTDSVTVSESSPPVISAEVTSLPFADTHTIEVTATGLGTYEYSLNNGAWQESNIFKNVTLGYHTVSANDVSGCGIDTTTVLVIDYPLFFTPNGDGYNDTWNIVGINTLPNAVINIFDRYGKLLKQLIPTGEGWNGTFNGIDLPTNGYWFTVEYNEPTNGERKQFRAHFTLKR